MIAKRMYLLQTGQVIRLKCEPIDPRSLFSGDYVILNYTISQLSSKYHTYNIFNERFRRNQTVYVALQKVPEQVYWQAVAVSGDLRKLKERYPVVIRGVNRSRWGFDIRYGVEHYFVPQFEGKWIENEIRDVTVDVALSSSGESAIKALYIKGKKLSFQ
jgi:uncharacterized membrane-anchored protein